MAGLNGCRLQLRNLWVSSGVSASSSSAPPPAPSSSSSSETSLLTGTPMDSHPALVSTSADAEEVGALRSASGSLDDYDDYESGTAWLASTPTETPIMPLVSIVDAHHHFFTSGFPKQALGMPAIANSFGAANRTHMGNRYMPAELVRDLADNNVTHTVFVTCGEFWDKADDVPKHLRCVGETRRCQEIADAALTCALPHLCAAIVAHADLSLGKEIVDELLDAHISAGANLRGVRDNAAASGDDAIFNATKDLNKLANSDFRAGVEEVMRRGLTYDCYIFHLQLEQLADLANTFPELTTVCNHGGSPLGVGTFAPLTWEDNETAAQWRAGVTKLAKCPNVFMKLGGFTMPATGLIASHNLAKPPTSREVADTLAPWFNFLMDNFGTDRCMFESNFPVDKTSCGYTTLWNAFKRVTLDRGCTGDEVAMLFAGTAKRVYRL
ncbi:hypothetical protein PPROV_001101400 [Pycnococcus provasolii]|uniref:Amidohydrolase-related domain-containing protein n=1 Tax=Pycnococcus provasolii TaxID=41880 RepID=A0A830HXU5_9CHLO|nr:hypothetical protein PPROV_001101400 [Pycnococcus provasolii]